MKINESASFIVYQDNEDGTCTGTFHIKREFPDEDLDTTFIFNANFEEMLQAFARNVTPEEYRVFDEIATEIPNTPPDF